MLLVLLAQCFSQDHNVLSDWLGRLLSINNSFKPYYNAADSTVPILKSPRRWSITITVKRSYPTLRLYDEVMTWKLLPHFWSFVQRIAAYRWFPVPKGQLCWALMFPMSLDETSSLTNCRVDGDLWRSFDVTNVNTPHQNALITVETCVFTRVTTRWLQRV